MKVFLDFDDTLFNTRDFINDFSSVFVSLGISSEVYRETRKRAYTMFDTTTSVYDIDKHLAELAVHKPDFDTAQAKHLADVFLADTARYVFADVIPFFESMREKQVACYILSFGQSVFQRQKINGTGLQHYCKDIFIVQEEKSLSIAACAQDESERVLFVDDRAEYIAAMKKALPYVTTIQITRPEGRYQDASSAQVDFLMHDLNDIVNQYE